MTKNTQRELQKALSAIEDCLEYLGYTARANAKLHLADEVFYSPLHAKLTSVRAGIKILLPDGEEKSNG